MSKIYNLSIVLSFAGLWIASTFSDQFETVLGFILIFSFGILHGSNDILLINSISNLQVKFPFFKVLSIYLITVCAAIVLFYYFPLIALVIFVVFSAFHFGEQHWSNHEFSNTKFIRHTLYFIYGLLVLQILFILNIEEVIEIIQSITAYKIDQILIIYSLICNVILFVVFMIYLGIHSTKFRSTLLLELFYLFIFGVIFQISSLIWGFTIYFILWHSIPSLFEQVSFIYGDFNKKNVLNYIIKALPYWLVSLAGITILYFIFREEKMFSAIVFSFIAAVTFPHALIITKMFKNKKAQSIE